MVSLLVFRVGGSITIGDALLIASFILTALEVVSTGRSWSVTWAGIVAAALIIVGGGIVTFAAADTVGSLLVLVRVLFLLILIPWTMSILLSTPARVQKALGFLAAGAAACAAGSIVQLALGDVIPGSEITTGGRYPGFAVHVSDTGGITCLAVVYGTGIALSRRKRTRLLGLLILLAGLAGLILSGSVSGMLAAVGGGLLLLVWHRVRILKIAYIGAAVLLAGSWAQQAMSTNEVALTPMERMLQVTGVTADTRTANTSSSRWESIVSGWNGFAAHPVVGAGLEPTASFTFLDFPAHNIVVASLFQGGLLFTAGMAIVVWKAVRRILPKRHEGGTLTIAAAGVVTALIFAMTAPSFYNRYFWIPVALALVASRIKPRAAARAPESRPSASMVRGNRSHARVSHPTVYSAHAL